MQANTTTFRQRWSKAKLKKSVKRIAFVKDQGWATMPDETSPDNKIASECAKQLMLIAQ